MKITAILWSLALFFPTLLYAGIYNSINYPISTVIPFVGTLLTIAVAPLLIPAIWHRHYGKIISVWPFILLFILTQYATLASLQAIVADTLIHEFIPFIIMVGTLYIVSGGIVIKVQGEPSPWVNTVYLLGASLMSSIIGTTGAAILFIRPFLKLNTGRTNQQHLAIFFIFLVCNIGGCLSVIGDPPLFLGYLNGISFSWPIKNMLQPFCILMTVLLTMFYGLDWYYFQKQYGARIHHAQKQDFKSESINSISLHGWGNVILLCTGLIVILISGQNVISGNINLDAVQLSYQSIMRDSLLVILSLISLLITPHRRRTINGFTWAPLIEITKIFAVIFATAAPVLLMLKAGKDGQFAPLVHFINDNKHIQDTLYFWISGMLSGFLDNAPTYLVFFNLAGGNANTLMSTLSITLLAFSMGSVFMGALTYIGNAPNFIVKAVAEENNITMPSFFGYMKWSFLCLLPLFILLNLIFLR